MIFDHCEGCCAFCHQHSNAKDVCTKFDKKANKIPEEHLLHLHVKPNLKGQPTFLIVEVRRFDEKIKRDVEGRVVSYEIEKIPFSGIDIGHSLDIPKCTLNPFLSITHHGPDLGSGHFTLEINSDYMNSTNSNRWFRVSDDHELKQCGEPCLGYIYVFRQPYGRRGCEYNDPDVQHDEQQETNDEGS